MVISVFPSYGFNKIKIIVTRDVSANVDPPADRETVAASLLNLITLTLVS